MNGVQKAEVRKMVQEALKELTEGNDMVDNPTKEEIKDMADRAEDSYAEYAKEPNEETIEAMEEVRDGKCLRHAPAYSVEEFKPSFVNTEIKVGLKKLDKMVIVDFLEIDDYFARLVTDNGGFVSSNGFELKIESDKHYETQLEAHRVITSCISKKEGTTWFDSNEDRDEWCERFLNAIKELTEYWDSEDNYIYTFGG